MSHLTDDQLYDLAVKIIEEKPFTKEEILQMKHVAQCDECYDLLCCTMAMVETTQNLGSFAAVPEPVREPVQESITAALRLVINAVQPILDQINAGSWEFNKRVILAGARSTKDGAASIQKLEDIDDSQTYIAYDPEKRLLVVQLAYDPAHGTPSASILEANGTSYEITFERHGDLLCAEIYDLEEGEHSIFLEK